MKVKKYIAPSMQEAMKKIRSEMGNDAVILNSKMIYTGGFLGLFAKKKIEVIAAMDPDIPRKMNEDTQNSQKVKSKLTETTKQEKINEQTDSNVTENNSLLNEIIEMKKMIKSISSNEKNEYYPELLQDMLNKLVIRDVNPDIRGQIMSELLEYWYKQNGQVTKEKLKLKENELFIELLKDIDFGGVSYKKKYINVIGPTGVGKTTTLAKLAAECVIQKQKKVAFITTDTYRIAAIDQLKTYAKILNVPLEVCYSIDDFKAAQKKFAMYDYVFIDTAGRNFLDSQYVNDLRKLIDFTDEMETFLVLAATAKATDMLAVYKQFSVIPINKLIFTKMDETSTRGTLFDVMLKTKKGIAYTTHGQNVPDDIEMATREKIVNQILR
ncbi:flagellar biosynthesis protein FlhF [Metabacillus crassostreae]|uniref:flagellar biosynthesis protein FlhF n=1 Tax=Metabacillus crassostreae TaxID=929098 RepID=UPI001956E3A7|nr:flagellar biosynthesis protein FlhF [Metabacillus crassostreae]MBM7603305.1 flagellar biosynthesis protein FlhF [Metabacillus crassostreae]